MSGAGPVKPSTALFIAILRINATSFLGAFFGKCQTEKQNAPADPRVREGINAGVGVRHALFPDAGIRRPGMAAGSPTLFSTASGVVGLIAGPFSALRPLNC